MLTVAIFDATALTWLLIIYTQMYSISGRSWVNKKIPHFLSKSKEISMQTGNDFFLLHGKGLILIIQIPI